MKRCSEQTQTLHAGCRRAEPKISPRHRPPSQGAGWPKFKNEKVLRETETLCAGCSKSEPKIFCPTSDSLVQDGQNLISWRWSLPLHINPVWWRSMHAISSYRRNRPTNKQTGAITIHCAAASLACSVKIGCFDAFLIWTIHQPNESVCWYQTFVIERKWERVCVVCSATRMQGLATGLCRRWSVVWGDWFSCTPTESHDVQLVSVTVRTCLRNVHWQGTVSYSALLKRTACHIELTR